MPYTDGKTYVTINTDAGFKDGIVTYGIWISSERGRFKYSGMANERYLCSNEAELIAICIAVNLVDKNLKHILSNCNVLCINTDSKNAITVLKNKNMSNKFKRFTSYYFNIIDKWRKEKNFSIKLRWVKGHSNNSNARQYVNNWADKEARKIRENYENYKKERTNG